MVIAVVGVLAAALITVVDPIGQINKARDSQRQSDLTQLKTTLDAYYSDNNYYPTQLDQLTVSYIKQLPKDPTTGLDYKYAVDQNNLQWNVLFAKLSRSPTNIASACPLITSCNISCLDTTYSCSVSGKVDCEYIKNQVPLTSPCEVPVAEPTSTSTPTSTPAPTNTPAPTSTPTPTPTPVFARCINESSPDDYQFYGNGMIGCNGSYAFSTAPSLCAAGSHLCSIDEYLAKGGATVGTNNNAYRWIDTQADPAGSLALCNANEALMQRGSANSSMSFLAAPSNRISYLGSCPQNRGFYVRDLHTKSFGAMCCSDLSPLPASAEYKRVFVTSTGYDGDLKSAANSLLPPADQVSTGLDGADKLCQIRADAVNLGGVWKAWISDTTKSPANQADGDVWTQAEVPYRLLYGVTVANNWVDLTDGGLLHRINKAESGVNVINTVWTGTKADGSRYTVPVNGAEGNNNCDGWTRRIGVTGKKGITFYNDKNWTEYSAVSSCNSTYYLYCFEQ